MSEPQTKEDAVRGDASGSLEHEALFAQLVMQQANMALMFLGKGVQPESGESVKDPDAARLFIDQLEMIEIKTRGNLSKSESGLLKQTLMGLRLAFVEAVETPSAPAPASPPPSAPASAGSGTTPAAAGTGAASPPIEEHPKKFSKKY